MMAFARNRGPEAGDRRLPCPTGPHRSAPAATRIRSIAGASRVPFPVPGFRFPVPASRMPSP